MTTLAPLRSRIIGHRRVPASSIRPHPENYRLHPDRQRSVLQASLAGVGFARSVLAYADPEWGLTAIDGHLRLDLAGEDVVDVELLDVSRAEARELLAVVDPITALAVTDAGKLDMLLAEIGAGSAAVDALLAALPSAPSDASPADPETTAAPIGVHYRHAGLGVWACRRTIDDGDKAALDAWKRAPSAHGAFTALAAGELVALVREWQPCIRPDWVATCPPAGASAGKEYPAGFLAKAVAVQLGIDFVTTLERTSPKKYHGRHYSLGQTFTLLARPPSVALVIDDVATSGATMRESLRALRADGVPAFGFAWWGND